MVECSGVQGLLSITGDSSKSYRLERLLSNFAASYKLYWFRALLDEVAKGNFEIPFSRMAARMVASAWYPIVYFRLNLGASDVLSECVDCAREVIGLPMDAGLIQVVSALEECQDKGLKRRLKNLTNYVPYRFIRPFYSEKIAHIASKEGRSSLPESKVNNVVRRLNQIDSLGAPYVFNRKCDGLIVDSDWAAYLRNNMPVISGWLDMKLVEFLQKRNPSVPAISLKIRMPNKRELAEAKRYWKEASSLVAVSDVYTGRRLAEVEFEEPGLVSIDHFIPWSFVLHDEPWNLTPTTRSENSSKGDRLPDLEQYLDPFASQQFSALMAVRGTGRHRKYLEKYLAVDANALSYEPTKECEGRFIAHVKDALRPLHQIALNQGYALWHPHFDYEVMCS